jgi:flagellar basal-body rod protein FlgG
VISALRAAASGLSAQQLSLDVIGNNIANINTPGFKMSRVNFREIVENAAVQPDSAQAVDLRGGVKVADVRPVLSTGPITQTGQPWDMAINGAGFFPMTLADGSTAYTRHGAFQLSMDGSLVDANGNHLQTDARIPQGTESVHVLANGAVTATVNGQFKTLGSIKLAVFPNPGGLEAVGSSLFKESDASGVATAAVPGSNEAGAISSGYLEGSNVDFSTEMVNMLVARRAYGISLKSVQTIDEMVQEANSLPR